MQANPVLGILLHAIGGLAAASFYIPYKNVKGWAWESYWLVGGVFSWLVAPLVGAIIICPNLLETLTSAPPSSLFWTYIFGVLWGIGGLTFGLSMRYLGLSLGYALALGFCAAFGTIIPPIFQGEFIDMLAELSGQVTFAGVAVCLGGITICGWAGVRKEGELSDEEKQATIKEFNFTKGLWVAIFAGVMSACMAFAFAAGKPILDSAVEHGAPKIFSNLPVLVVALLGGLTTNAVWCLFLNAKNGTAHNYRDAGEHSLIFNYLLCALGGVTWYLQFFFYGMGTTQMGEYDFSSWTIHMAFIIAFSNLWGLIGREWKGTSTGTRSTVFVGIIVLILSTVVVGAGNFIASEASETKETTTIDEAAQLDS
ncbi:MAG: L-rhamnose/proton symporter RhaT [Candidatus Hydrogenedentota bacterium]